MKKMTFDEFQKRAEKVAKALKIFTPHFTDNVTVAFEMYQKILASEEMPVHVSSEAVFGRTMTPLDDYVRPKCPEEGTELRLRVGAVDADGKKWETAWVCPVCAAEYYSDKTVEGWMNELPKRGSV